MSDKPQKKYVEPGEPSNKGVLLALGACCLLVVAAFAYFMIFHFRDVFYEKQVVSMPGLILFGF